MSYTQTERDGKDILIFLEEGDDHTVAEATGKSADEDPQSAAFNPETGEINWDCPCLGGMANGPCGDAFKAAFSCFVYSTDEPKGVNCIEKFRGMQDCFRLYPDVYGNEIDDDDEEDEDEGEKYAEGEDKNEKREAAGAVAAASVLENGEDGVDGELEAPESSSWLSSW
ncbi:hypothetical protein BC938DRAFT_472665, partial [Jimgerdemannia flammicorona]